MKDGIRLEFKVVPIYAGISPAGRSKLTWSAMHEMFKHRALIELDHGTGQLIRHMPTGGDHCGNDLGEEDHPPILRHMLVRL